VGGGVKMADDRTVYKFEGDASGLIRASKAAKTSIQSLGTTSKKTDTQLKNMRVQSTLLSRSLLKLNAAFMAGAKSSGMFAAATLAAGAALGRFFQNMADAQNELSDLSSRTGVSTKSLAGLRLAAKGSGQDFKAVSSALKPLALRLGQANLGMKTAILGFKAVGVTSLRAADGGLKSADAVLLEMTETLSGMENPTERAAAASLALGSAGTKLVQALGGESLKEFSDAAEKFGMDTGPAAARAADEWQRSMANLDLVMRPFTTDVMVWATRQINNFSLAWVYLSTLLEELSKNILPNMGSALLLAFVDLNIKAVGYADSILQTFMGAAEGYAKLIELITGNTAISDKVSEYSLKMKDAADGIKKYWDGVKEDIGTNSELGKSFEKATEKAKEFWDWQNKILEQRTGGGLSTPGGGAGGWEDIDLSRSGGAGIVEEGEWEPDIDLSASGGKLIEIHDQALEKLGETSKILDGITGQMTDLTDPTGLFRDILGEISGTMEAIAEADFSNLQDTLGVVSGGFKALGNIMKGVIDQQIRANDELTEKQKKNLKILFAIQKASAITSIVIDTATAIMRALAELGPVAGGIASGFITATGIAQVATVASQKPPFHIGGIIPAAPGRQGVQINALPGEAVLNRDATAGLGAEGVADLNSGRGGSSPVMVEMVYKHRVFDVFVSDNISKGGPLSDAINSGRRVGHRSRG
jgi:hypothetical protein